MTDLGTSLAQRFLRDGVPLTLLLDLADPDGLRAALAHELAASDVAAAPAPPVAAPIRLVRSA
jgi:hypothetical protein